MKPHFIGIGLTLIGLGAILSAVGHHDGVLGADDPQAFTAQDLTRSATTRLLVVGTPADAGKSFASYRTELIMPAAFADPLQSGNWVPVQVEDTQAEAYLLVTEQVPQPGTVLVFRGDIQAHFPIYEPDRILVSNQPILLLQASEYYEPILFKT